MQIWKKILCIAAVAVLLLTALSGCAQETRKTFDSSDDFEHATLGVVTGSLYDGYSRTLYPEAKIDYYKRFPEIISCLKQGKVDGCMLDEPNYNAIKRSEPYLTCMDVPEYDVEIGFGFQKNEEGGKLQSQMNELLTRLKADGTVDRLIEKWYGTTEPTETVIAPDFSDNPTPLRVAIDSGRKPFVYLLNSQPAGFEIEVLYMFCEEFGYRPTFEDLSFSNALAGLSTNVYDLVAGGLYMTPERKQSVNFSDPYMYANVVMVVCGEVEQGNFLDDIRESFEKSFVREGRWKLIVRGIGTTLLITACSAVCGTLFGFGIYMLCRKFQRMGRKIAKIFTVLVNGTPIVVILMILYYVVFGQTNLSGTVVAVIGFSLTTGAFVYEKLSVAVSGIDHGQTEAALAMGFTPTGAFFHVVLPQTMKFFLPIYRGEMVSLLKATAVVGYIAVQDLTQMSDIIRSNTFEAFFPLIASALIYLALSFGMIQLVDLVIRRLEPKNRSKARILKGVVEK